MKKFARYIFDFCILGVSLYLLTVAIESGEAQLRTSVVSYDESPVIYTIFIIVMIAIIGIWIAIIGSKIHRSIDKKIKAFGGSYNINTFKAVLKNMFRSS